FFFFQAEDGIRDFHVTGVQTCALPILDVASVITWCSGLPLLSHGSGVPPYRSAIWSINAWLGEVNRNRSSLDGRVFPPLPVATRSEERRVGKECRGRGCGEHEREHSEQ